MLILRFGLFDIEVEGFGGLPPLTSPSTPIAAKLDSIKLDSKAPLYYYYKLQCSRKDNHDINSYYTLVSF